jgi:hypothetical protein
MKEKQSCGNGNRTYCKTNKGLVYESVSPVCVPVQVGNDATARYGIRQGQKKELAKNNLCGCKKNKRIVWFGISAYVLCEMVCRCTFHRPTMTFGMRWHGTRHGVAWRGCPDSRSPKTNTLSPRLISLTPRVFTLWGFPRGFPIASPPLPPISGKSHKHSPPLPRSPTHLAHLVLFFVGTTFCL